MKIAQVGMCWFRNEEDFNYFLDGLINSDAQLTEVKVRQSGAGLGDVVFNS